MSAAKITPAQCFSVTTSVDIENTDWCLELKNGWTVFDARLPNTVSEIYAWKELCKGVATVFYRKEGEFAESTICGLKLGSKMVFFDENCELREEFYEKMRAGDLEFVSGIQLRNCPEYSTLHVPGKDLVWFMTSSGDVHLTRGGNHVYLFNGARNVLQRDLVAAGRVLHRKRFVWESDLLKVTTPDILKPKLEEYLMSLIDQYRIDL